jgi:hypothetical protein
MPRVAIPVNTVTRAGIANATEVNGDTVNGHTLPNDGRTWLEVRNSNGAATARTVTIRLSQTVDGQTVTSRTKSIPAGTTHKVGPFPAGQYGDNLLVDVDNAELKLTAYRLA